MIRLRFLRTSGHIVNFIDDFENGWFVDPAELCKNNLVGCTRNSDGSYDIPASRGVYAAAVVLLDLRKARTHPGFTTPAANSFSSLNVVLTTLPSEKTVFAR